MIPQKYVLTTIVLAGLLTGWALAVLLSPYPIPRSIVLICLGLAVAVMLMRGQG